MKRKRRLTPEDREFFLQCQAMPKDQQDNMRRIMQHIKIGDEFTLKRLSRLIARGHANGRRLEYVVSELRPLP